MALLLLATAETFAQADKRIEAIKKQVEKINEDVARSEQEPEYSGIYTTELAINKGNGSYPAVGIYRPLVKFHYTYGDREKNPYPHRLIKIVVTIDRSDRKEYSEYFFNEAEQVISYMEKKDEVERRVYFAAGLAIRVHEGDRVVSPAARPARELLAAVTKDQANLVAIFRRTLGF